MELSQNQIAFLEHCKEIRSHALEMDNPLIVHHYDCDGISSGAIVCQAFIDAKKPFRRLCVKKLDDELIEQLKNEKNIIFVDLGSGHIGVNTLQNVIIIDHHQPVEGIEKPQANCMLFGMDGGHELSAASTAFCVFNCRVDLAIVGATGDIQYPFRGLNRYVVEKGIEDGVIVQEYDIVFYGRYSRPLTQFILYNDDPYIPQLSYKEERVDAFLSDLGIPLKKDERWRTYSDLNQEERKKLVSGLAELLARSNQERKARNLIDLRYVLKGNEKGTELYEVSEFATLLNACGRHGKTDIGVGVCLNPQEFYPQAKELLLHHRRQIRAGIEYALSHMQDLGPFLFVDGRGIIDEGIIGIICGMVLQNAPKPIFGISDGENETIKLSGRTSATLIKKGLNIGLMLRKVTKAVGGVGGGHAVAAGASFPKNKINEFLVELGKEVREFEKTQKV